jgi:Helix-turn-helix domain
MTVRSTPQAKSPSSGSGRGVCTLRQPSVEGRGTRGRGLPLVVGPGGAEPLHAMLGRRLRRFRLEGGLTRKTVAGQLGLRLDRVAAHERGKGRIAARDLIAYAEFYGVRLSAFFADH